MRKFQIDSNLKSSCNIPITSSRFSLHNYVVTRVEELISKFLLSQACHCEHPAASYWASTFICWEMLMEVSYFVFIPDCQGSFSYQGNITFSTSTQAPPWIQILLSPNSSYSILRQPFCPRVWESLLIPISPDHQTRFVLQRGQWKTQKSQKLLEVQCQSSTARTNCVTLLWGSIH